MAQLKQYKNRETITYKGVTWSYDKYYGEWRTKHKSLPTIKSTNFPKAGYWNIGGIDNRTPLGALKAWNKAQVDYYRRQARESDKHTRALTKHMKWYRSSRWNRS